MQRSRIFGLGFFSITLLCGVARADVFSNVPEALANGYQLVYTLPIENQAGYSVAGAVNYSVDNSASITAPFDRVAYYLELDDGNGLEYAYASVDAFTSNIDHVGLPISNLGVSFQQTVTNLNVVSNAGGVTTGSGIATGNIEFWPNNYSRTNALGLPGASDSSFDFGDTRGGSGDFGSFQVHNYGASETILAYNQWGGEQPSNNGDLGIGSAPSGNSDWTFARNTADYTVKNLQVLVRPSQLSIDSTLSRAIFQRDDQNQASVPVTGIYLNGISTVEARAVPRAGSPGSATDWQVIDANPTGGSYAGELTLDGGWYDIEVRSLSGASIVDQSMMERVGVGEVFVIAGQSNSANFGSSPLPAVDDRVSSFDYTNWRHGDDPQPIANGTGGSPWPALGDAIVADQNVPVGFISVGQGGTRVDQWLPGATNGPLADPLYDRLKDALEALGPDGARAVLWHQGESDNGANTSTADYQQDLEAVIAQSRLDAGFDIPWGIAQATFHPGSAEGIQQSVVDAQALVAANDPLNFVGALTDDLIGSTWRRSDNLHFNTTGLREHADRWFDALTETFDFVQFIGDFNADDAVDATDLAAWIAGYGSQGNAELADGDADGDQDADGTDFLAWQRSFGSDLGVAAVASSASVPEPSTLGMCLLACVAGYSQRRSRIAVNHE